MRTFLMTTSLALVLGCNDRVPTARTIPSTSPDEIFENPVDKQTYVAPGGWKKYQPTVSRLDEPAKKVKSEGVRLLTSQDDIAVRTTVQDLADFLREAEGLAGELLNTTGKPFKVMVQFTCTPAGHEVKMAHQGDATEEVLQRYYDGLKLIKKLAVKDGEVVFQLELSVRP